MNTPTRVLWFVLLTLNLPTNTVAQTTRFQSSSVKPRCGGSLSRDSGSITSPFYPANYPQNTVCTWEIVGSPYSIMRINIYIESLERNSACAYDFVQIHDGNAQGRVLGKICEPGIYSFFSSYNEMTIVFSSDFSIEGQGFEAQYYASYGVPSTTPSTVPGGQFTDCGGYLTADYGEIKSPRYPGNYPPNSFCSWQIAVPEHKTSYIQFNHIDLEYHVTCDFDYVKVYDGNAEPWKICGNQTQNYYGSSNYIVIEFRSDGSVEKSGFWATFYLFGVPSTTPSTVPGGQFTDCGGYLTADYGEIKSPRYPGNYPPNIFCRWQIAVPEHKTAYIQFNHVELEYHATCEYDYVKVYDGNAEPWKICGNQTQNYYGSSNYIVIEFKSDGSVEKPGFLATYNFFSIPSTTPSSVPGQFTDCGGNLTADYGEIKSPRYPGNYPPNSFCSWQIAVPEHKTSYIHFNHVDLEYHVTCDFDYVKVYDGNAEPWKICGNQTQNYYGSSNYIVIEFRSDGSVEKPGFWATYNFFAHN